MKKLIKYLLPVIAVLVFFAGTDKEDSSYLAKNHIEIISHSGIEAESHSTCITSEEHDICLPRQVSFASQVRLQSNARRVVSTNRHNVEFIKVGKIFNAGHQYTVQNNSTIYHSSLAEPAHRLLRLGKLII